MYLRTNLITLTLVLVMAVVSNGQTTNYCTICPLKQHTMCKYSELSNGSYCRTIQRTTMKKIEGGVDDTSQAQIVGMHNAARQKVASGLESRGKPGAQPAAANMRDMEWDTEMATLAQRWADQCTDTRDSCRKVSSFAVGQNVAKKVSFNATANWFEVIEMWNNEVRLMDKNKVCNYQERYNQNSHHYARMVWGPTYKVGCGFSSFKREADSKYSAFYVCNYGPGGILWASTTCLYTTGTACSSCPSGTACVSTATNSALCATSSPPTK